MAIKTLSIVIPAYNEGPTIYKILDKIKAVSLIDAIEKEVIIVNDCSTTSPLMPCGLRILAKSMSSSSGIQ